MKLYAAGESSKHVPMATRDLTSANVPTGFVHAVDPLRGLTALCGVEVPSVMLNLPWGAARSYDQCPTCVREARSLTRAA